MKNLQKITQQQNDEKIKTINIEVTTTTSKHREQEWLIMISHDYLQNTELEKALH